MPAPGPALIQHIMSKLLLAAAPIETLIKAIRGSAGEGLEVVEDVVSRGLRWLWRRRERGLALRESTLGDLSRTKV